MMTEVDESQRKDDLQDRAVGVIVGLMCGDVLGAPVEGHPASLIVATYPAGLRDFVSGEHMGMKGAGLRFGMYTDDTNASLALADSLVRCGRLDAQDAAESYARFFEHEPRRGYPDSAQAVMLAVLSGADIRATGRAVFSDGSFANGGGMRISPLAIPLRRASLTELRSCAARAVLSSHVHPEGVDGAAVQAAAVAHCLRLSGPEAFSAEAFLADLAAVAQSDRMRARLRHLRGHIGRTTFGDAVYGLGVDGAAPGFQIEAVVAVPCALWAFLAHPGQPEEAVIAAVALGGDTDTVASMTGAICGALHGCDWLPEHWTANLENGEYGRDYAVDLGRELAAMDLATTAYAPTASVCQKSADRNPK